MGGWGGGNRIAWPVRGALPVVEGNAVVFSQRYWSFKLLLNPSCRQLLVLVELTLLFGGGVLVLLVLRDKVVHVGLGLRELHLVHALTSVPVEECLAAEHAPH